MKTWIKRFLIVLAVIFGACEVTILYWGQLQPPPNTTDQPVLVEYKSRPKYNLPGIKLLIPQGYFSYVSDKKITNPTNLDLYALLPNAIAFPDNKNLSADIKKAMHNFQALNVQISNGSFIILDEGIPNYIKKGKWVISDVLSLVPKMDRYDDNDFRYSRVRGGIIIEIYVPNNTEQKSHLYIECLDNSGVDSNTTYCSLFNYGIYPGLVTQTFFPRRELNNWETINQKVENRLRSFIVGENK